MDSSLRSRLVETSFDRNCLCSSWEKLDLLEKSQDATFLFIFLHEHLGRDEFSFIFSLKNSMLVAISCLPSYCVRSITYHLTALVDGDIICIDIWLCHPQLNPSPPSFPALPSLPRYMPRVEIIILLKVFLILLR